MNAAEHATARERMVSRDIEGRGIHDAAVLRAMREVPRELFVADGLTDEAYDDRPLPIGQGQTISQPYIVALMAQAAELRPGDSVLEVGAGSGYAAAVFSRIAARVVAIERIAELADAAAARLGRLGYGNVEVHIGDGSAGWPCAAPFDAILVAAAAISVPPALKAQLAVGGRLIMPVGGRFGGQSLQRIVRVSETEYRTDDLGAVMFVPLIGDEGWRSASDDPKSR